MTWLFSMPLGFWLAVALVTSCFVSEWDTKRRIRLALEESDREWNECINQHHKTIAEAYAEGKPVQITMERR
jgi:hypothetical protein